MLTFRRCSALIFSGISLFHPLDFDTTPDRGFERPRLVVTTVHVEGAACDPTVLLDEVAHAAERAAGGREEAPGDDV
ncbi:hypothetical protein PR202_ga14705 [Eleusine coracana subsp. coracana]|uniref:Uncharacterized protein n=1 Tax=Eleusine coracana subsp. coracana TaxID=191504 RepID=A0AAV5CI53_ELECO|nr:hypothetical protein PR202_ga14705 [Eleusine coracana subsp. coracana]